MLNKIQKKIFCIGGPKTATKSLGKAFTILGLKNKSWDTELVDEYKKNDFSKIYETVNKYDSFEDQPWGNGDFYKDLDHKFPGSKFILTVRNIDDWISSYQHHFSSEGDNRIPELWQIKDFDNKKETLIKEFQLRNNNILEYFKNRPKDLLVLNICEGDGWWKLCDFLEMAIPDITFPYENKGHYKQDIIDNGNYYHLPHGLKGNNIT